MTTPHHPDDEVLIRHAAGRLAPGPTLIVDAHLDVCPQCRANLRRFEAVGGALLEATEPQDLTAGSLDRALARIERAAPPVPAARPRRRPALPEGVAWPAALEAYDVGPWRWLAPGMYISRVDMPEAKPTKVALLRIGPGRKLLQHTHAGTEWTYVVCGCFADDEGRYEAGAFVAADDHVEHQPVVEGTQDCISLVAVEGHLHIPGFAGRLMRFYVGL